MRSFRWIPKMLRREPARAILIRTGVGTIELPHGAPSLVDEALRAFGATSVEARADGWRAELPARTAILGVVPRDVDERITVSVGPGVVSLRCEPLATHSAHAAGAAVVIAVAAATWLLSWRLLPTATTLVAGLLLADVTRELALAALEKRLVRLAQDVSLALWPDQTQDTTADRVST